MQSVYPTKTMNQTNDIGLVMENYPDLGYDGWRIEPDDRLFAERRRDGHAVHVAAGGGER